MHPKVKGTIKEYSSFREALRDLLRMVLDEGYDVVEQDLREVLFVGYKMTEPKIDEELLRVIGIPVEWVKEEFNERVSMKPLNPGNAWKKWQDFWLKRLHEGRFSYTYAERLHNQLKILLKKLATNPTSKRGILCVWDPQHDLASNLEVPCTVFSQHTIRQGSLVSFFYQRSADAVNFLAADMYFYARLHSWLAEKTSSRSGDFVHMIGSLHIYLNDLPKAERLLEVI